MPQRPRTESIVQRIASRAISSAPYRGPGEAFEGDVASDDFAPARGRRPVAPVPGREGLRHGAEPSAGSGRDLALRHARPHAPGPFLAARYEVAMTSEVQRLQEIDPGFLAERKRRSARTGLSPGSSEAALLGGRMGYNRPYYYDPFRASSSRRVGPDRAARRPSGAGPRSRHGPDEPRSPHGDRAIPTAAGRWVIESEYRGLRGRVQTSSRDPPPGPRPLGRAQRAHLPGGNYIAALYARRWAARHARSPWAGTWVACVRPRTATRARGRRPSPGTSAIICAHYAGYEAAPRGRARTDAWW